MTKISSMIMLCSALMVAGAVAKSSDDYLSEAYPVAHDLSTLRRE